MHHAFIIKKFSADLKNNLWFNKPPSDCGYFYTKAFGTVILQELFYLPARSLPQCGVGVPGSQYRLGSEDHGPSEKKQLYTEKFIK